MDYCDVFISCLDSYSDGTNSLQRIHWWARDVMLNFSKSVPKKKQSHLLDGRRVNFPQIFIFVNYSLRKKKKKSNLSFSFQCPQGMRFKIFWWKIDFKKHLNHLKQAVWYIIRGHLSKAASFCDTAWQSALIYLAFQQTTSKTGPNALCEWHSLFPRAVDRPCQYNDIAGPIPLSCPLTSVQTGREKLLLTLQAISVDKPK